MGTPPSFLNSAAIIGGITFIACILLAIVGLSILGGAKKADMGKTAKTSAVSIIGIIFIVVALTGGAIGLGTAVYSTVAK